MTEIWWDQRRRARRGRQHRAGMYRYVDGGKRYLPGKHPTTDPRVFDPNGSPTILTKFPDNEKSPDYEHKHFYTKD